MTSDVTREEFTHVGVRVDVLEREVEGEKMVTRHILEQTRHNSDDLGTLKSDMVVVKSDLRRVEQKVDTLTRELPKIVGEVVREVFRERDKEP